MSRKSIAEHVAEKRRVYAKSGSAKRARPRTTYFVAELPRIVREFEACIALIKPFAVKSNRHSGLNRPILDAIECKSGERYQRRGSDGFAAGQTAAPCT